MSIMALIGLGQFLIKHNSKWKFQMSNAHSVKSNDLIYLKILAILIKKASNCFYKFLIYFKWLYTVRDRGRLVIEGAHIHIFGFTKRENNQFQKKLMRQNPNI